MHTALEQDLQRCVQKAGGRGTLAAERGAWARALGGDTRWPRSGATATGSVTGNGRCRLTIGAAPRLPTHVTAALSFVRPVGRLVNWSAAKMVTLQFEQKSYFTLKMMTSRRAEHSKFASVKLVAARSGHTRGFREITLKPWIIQLWAPPGGGGLNCVWKN